MSFLPRGESIKNRKCDENVLAKVADAFGDAFFAPGQLLFQQRKRTRSLRKLRASRIQGL